MKWYDAYGERIDAGDIVMDTDARRIGRVVYKYNRPCIDIWKVFSVDTLGYEPVTRTATNEAYIRMLATKSDLYHKLYRGRLNHVEIIKKAKDMFREPQRMITISMPQWDAPVPWM